MNLWRLYNSAAAYGKRPSEFMQLETEIAAWALDETCLMIGRKFENLLNEGKNPFEGASTTPSLKHGYAPIAKGNIRKVNINPNGTW